MGRWVSARSEVSMASQQAGLNAWIHRHPVGWALWSALTLGLLWGLVGRTLLFGLMAAIVSGLMAYLLARRT